MRVLRIDGKDSWIFIDFNDDLNFTKNLVIEKHCSYILQKEKWKDRNGKIKIKFS